MASSGLVLLGLACQEVGASIAVLLFPVAGANGMVALRLVFTALILLAIARPAVRGRGRRDWMIAVGYGLVLAAMNWCFYHALARLPLGPTVTIEVLGPLVLSVVTAVRGTGRWWPATGWALLALAGVALLGRAGWDRLDPVGVAFAAGAAVCWAGYILATSATGARFAKLDGIALGMSVGALAVLPAAVLDGGSRLLAWHVLTAGLAVAVLSSTVPYVAELIALRRISPAVFGILMSMAPAVASLAGWLLLDQRLGVLELAGIGCVVLASGGAVSAAGEVTPQEGLT